MVNRDEMEIIMMMGEVLKGSLVVIFHCTLSKKEGTPLYSNCMASGRRCIHTDIRRDPTMKYPCPCLAREPQWLVSPIYIFRATSQLSSASIVNMNRELRIIRYLRNAFNRKENNK
jgi:hypothetical protein